MINKHSSNKSICENSMNLMTNIMKVSYISIANIGFRTSAPLQQMARATHNPAPSLSRYPKNLRLQKPIDSTQRVSYLINPDQTNRSSLNMIKDGESNIDMEASDFIKTVLERNFKD